MKDKVKVEDLRIGQIVFSVDDINIFAVKIQEITMNSISGSGLHYSISNVFIKKEDAVNAYISFINKKVRDDMKYLEERIDILKEQE